MLRQILSAGVVMAVSSVASASQLITPAGWGNVDGTGAFEAVGMFNAQPTWNGTTPVGGDASFEALMATWDPVGATAYIDFGSNYGSIRIEQLWTKGMEWRATPGFPYSQVWWDNDIASATLTGIDVAATINFNTKGSLGTGSWQQDFDYTASPITPEAQYLKLRIPTQAAGINITGTTELAIIGTIVTVPEPTSMAALATASLLLIRRRR